MSTLGFIYALVFFGGLSLLAISASVPVAVVPLAAMFSVVVFRFIRQKLHTRKK